MNNTAADFDRWVAEQPVPRSRSVWNLLARKSFMKTFLLLVCLPASVVVGALVVGNASMDRPRLPSAAVSNQVTADPPVATQRVTKGGYFACITEEAFSESTSASIDRDYVALHRLVSSGQCMISPAGLSVTLLQVRWTGRVRVRMYDPTFSATVWTNTENIVAVPVVKPAMATPPKKATTRQTKGSRS